MANTTQLEAIAQLCEQIRTLDTRPFEQPEADLGELSRSTGELLLRGVSLLESVMDEDEAAEEITSDSPIADVAFIACLDLRQRTAGLRNSERSGDRWVLLDQCCSARRHVMRAMSEVAKTLQDDLPADPRLRELAYAELEIALASRHAYYSLFTAVRRFEAQLQAGLIDGHRVLRLSGTCIAQLIGRDVYRELRVEDRRQLHALQTRIMTWNREDTHDQLGARRLWMDVMSCVTLLRGIHRRAVLIEYDYELVERVLDAGHLDLLTADEQRHLIEAADRDEELHEALRASSNLPGRARVELVRAGLERLRDQLATLLGRPSAGDTFFGEPISVFDEARELDGPDERERPTSRPA